MVDYSKWKNIEISDDEDDTHPNIDTASLFRWRHQARIERMEERKREKEELQKRKEENEKKIYDLQQKTENKEDKSFHDEFKKLEIEKKEIEKQEQDILKAERNAPWNVDTISKESWSKTVINRSKALENQSELTDEELEKRYKEHVQKYESQMKEFAMISKFEDAKSFLLQNPELVCEQTSHYLTIWCLNLEIEGKRDLMEYISKQVTSLHYILELAKHTSMDPRQCASMFYYKALQGDRSHLDALEDEIQVFRQRIINRAKEKIQEAIKECEEEEKQKRLGPGGLDPHEVFESLPEPLQKCFEARDTELLQKTILEMDPEDAKYHMKRCVDSGLWIPDMNSSKNNSETENKEKIEEKNN